MKIESVDRSEINLSNYALQIFEAFNSQSELINSRVASQYFNVGDYVLSTHGFSGHGVIESYNPATGTYRVKRQKESVSVPWYELEKSNWYMVSNAGGGDLYSDWRHVKKETGDYMPIVLDTGSSIKVYNDKLQEYKDLIQKLRSKYGTSTQNEILFVKSMMAKLEEGEKMQQRDVEALMKRHSISDIQTATQLTEKAIVEHCRKVATKLEMNNSSIHNTFEYVKEIYDNQPVIKPRDGQSRSLQQYSTPCPISWILGRFVRKHPLSCDRAVDYSVLEPTAGNGMLTVAFPPHRVTVNELDEIRFANLTMKDPDFAEYHQAINMDANILPVEDRSFDCVITNPPFAKLESDFLVRKGRKGERETTYTFKALDHKLAILALEKMKDDGRCAIIVGGRLASKMYDHRTTYWEPSGKLRGGEWMQFLNYINRAYFLNDVIYCDGDLYRKQGTTFPIVILLINGRREQFNNDPLMLWHDYDADIDSQVTSFNDLLKRVGKHIFK